MRIRIAQIRCVPEKGKLRENHETLLSVLSEITPHGVDVVVTPECFLDGYVATEDRVDADSLRAYAVPTADHPYVQSVAAWARGGSSWVILGCSRLDSARNVRNSALVLDRHGVTVGWYDKTHCQTHDMKYAPGDALPAFESDFGPFGVMICADRRWPETVRTLALRGARVILNPTYGMHGEKNLRMMQTRSYESEVFIAFTHPRQSLITGPTGDIVCNDTDEACRFAVTEIDLDVVDEVRAGRSAHLRDRRPDLYAP